MQRFQNNIKKLSLFSFLILTVKLISAQSEANVTVNPAVPAAVLGIFGLFWVLWVFFFITIFTVGILGIIFWIFMLIDCAKRNFVNENDKVVWILVLAFTSWIGAIIYYFVIKRKDKKK